MYFGIIDKLKASLEGYVQLQSGRISRGRQTMMDASDEEKTKAWVADVFNGSDSEREWPLALRPQRPEGLEMRRIQVKGVEANLRRNRNISVLEKPPTFLQMKDTQYFLFRHVDSSETFSDS